MNKISIIIPVFNEKSSLYEVVDNVKCTEFGLEKEIIIVDDCSTDGTKDLYGNIDNCIILCHEKNEGKGAAIRTGLKHATGDIIVIQDADLEYNPKDYIQLIDKIKSDEADVVYGSRLINNNFDKFLILSYIANKFLSFLTRILYNAKLTDMETCYKAFRADIIKKIDIKSNRFDFEPEVTAKLLKQNIRLIELPISYNARNVVQGKKIGFIDGIQAITTLIKYKFFD